MKPPLKLCFGTILVLLAACVTTPLSLEKKRADFESISQEKLLATFREVLEEDGYTIVRWNPGAGQLMGSIQSNGLIGTMQVFDADVNENYPTGSQSDILVSLQPSGTGGVEAVAEMSLIVTFARRGINESQPSQTSVEDPRPYAKLFDRVRTALKPKRAIRVEGAK